MIDQPQTDRPTLPRPDNSTTPQPASAAWARSLALLAAGWMLLAAGCADLVTSVYDREPPAGDKAVAQADSSAEQDEEDEAEDEARDEDGGAAEDEDQPEEVERVEAKAGVGKRGQRLKADHVNQTIAQPVVILFEFEQRAIFDFKIKPALRLYEAENGQLPQTHEEFMDKIIQANRIELPELPPKQRYVWDPERGKLMVERPKQD